MPILNNTLYRIHSPTEIIDVTASGRKHNLYASFDFSKNFYWYVEFNNIHSFDKKAWLQVLPTDIINLIKNKKIFLLICNYPEAFLIVVEHIYTLLVEELQIPEEQLILMTMARDGVREVNKVATKLNKKPIKVIWASISERVVHHMIEGGPQNDVKNKNFSYNKKFINLNRHWRHHRPAFVALLAMNDLLKYGYVSLIESTKYNWSWYHVWENILEKFSTLSENFLKHKDLIMNSTPLIVDKSSSDNNPDWHQPELNQIYNDSYFSVISETTYFSDESRTLTEKTLAAFYHRHPFLLLAPPLSLEMLRERGYKTFSPFINENYDKEFDDSKRMSMVLEETKRLCELNQVEIKEFVSACEELCNHNYLQLTKNIKPYVALN